jgi:hypothetical protein
MSYNYLIFTSTVCYFIGYLPDLYANWKNKNANIYNVPEKLVFLIGTCFAMAYSIQTQNDALILNYAPLLSLDIMVLLMRVYYWRMNNNHVKVIEVDAIEPQEDIECNSSTVIVEEQDAIQPQHYPLGTHENFNSFSSRNLTMGKGKELEFPEGWGGGKGAA